VVQDTHEKFFDGSTFPGLVFYFRGLRKPRKYFYNENFQIYGSFHFIREAGSLPPSSKLLNLLTWKK